MSATPLQLITSGFNSKVIRFTETSACGAAETTFEQRTLHDDDLASNHSFMVPNSNLRGVYYAVNEIETFNGQNTGTVSRWTLTVDGAFVKNQVVSSGGPDPTHTEFDPTRNLLYVANYGVNGGGSFAVFTVHPADGGILDMVYNEPYGAGSNAVPDRQKDSHPHAINVFGSNVYVTDLGADKIWHYRVDNKRNVKNIGATDCPKGCGPRHMAIDSRSHMAYVMFELVCEIGMFRIDQTSGCLSLQGTVQTVDPPANSIQYGSEIEVHPTKNLLYASNRGHGPLVVYDIEEEGGLVRKQAVMTPEVWPRHFCLSSCGCKIFLVEQMLGRLQVWDIAEDGQVSLRMETPSDNKPSFVHEVQL